MIKRYYEGTLGETNNYRLNYTNNNQSVLIVLKVQSDTVYSGYYLADPVTGFSPYLPATSQVISLTMTGKTILSATLNGVSGTIVGSGVSWGGVTGNLDITVTTN